MEAGKRERRKVCRVGVALESTWVSTEGDMNVCGFPSNAIDSCIMGVSFINISKNSEGSSLIHRNANNFLLNQTQQKIYDIPQWHDGEYHFNLLVDHFEKVSSFMLYFFYFFILGIFEYGFLSLSLTDCCVE